MNKVEVRNLFVLLILCFGACKNDDTSSGLELAGRLDFSATLTDVSGYSNESKEYAIIGFQGGADSANSGGVYVIDVTNPHRPTQASELTTATGSPAKVWVDAKTWGNYMYIGNGRSDQSLIYDMSNPAAPQQVGSFPASLNTFITADGFMYADCPGLRLYDLNPDPTNPQLLWEIRPGDHNNCHDCAEVDGRLYEFHGPSGTSVYDVSNRTSPQLLGTITSPEVKFHHSGWPTADHRYLFICDELALHPSPDVTVWDIGDPANPQMVAGIGDSTASIHNLYIKGRYAYAAYYTAGFHIYDVADPLHITLVEGYDTSTISGEFYQGAYGAYVFAPSGNFYVSDMQRGLHVFTFREENSKPGTITGP